MAIAAMKQEWQKFRHDPPGHRFVNHHDRMQQRSRVFAVLRTVLGVALLLVGIALLFIPGPGLLVIVFGLGLFAGHSRRLAALLDRAEPPVRRGAQRAQRWWRRLPVIAKVGIATGAAVIAAAALYAMWRLWFAG